MHIREYLPELYLSHPPALLPKGRGGIPAPGASAVGLLGLLVALLVTACGPDVRHPALRERTVPPDTSALTDVIRNQGGPILLELTGWATPRVIEELVAAGLEPLPGYDQVERLDSMGLNLVGGIVTPESLDSVLAAPYIVSARSAHASGQRR